MRVRICLGQYDRMMMKDELKRQAEVCHKVLDGM